MREPLILWAATGTDYRGPGDLEVGCIPSPALRMRTCTHGSWLMPAPEGRKEKDGESGFAWELVTENEAIPELVQERCYACRSEPQSRYEGKLSIGGCERGAFVSCSFIRALS